MSFLAILHIVFAVIVILLVLVQDSKGGGVGGAFGGGTSQSILGPTGTPNLLNKLTRYMVIGFAITSVVLSNMTSKKDKSALDTLPVENAAAPSNPATAPAAPTNPAATETAPTTTAPAENK